MKRIGIVGSGNWGTTIARVIAENVIKFDDFERNVKIWAFDEIFEGESLVHIINTKHENPKYLPGFSLPENIVAFKDLSYVAQNSDFLVFVIPHQFLNEALDEMVNKINPNAVGLSLIKGLSIHEDKIELVTDTIERTLKIKCGSLMGANIANDIAAKEMCESTLAFPDPVIGNEWKKILHCSYFQIEVIPDLVLQQLCGTLKNIVAVAGGLVDGLGYGQSTKAAILRQGFVESFNFAQWAFPNRGIRIETMFESCGFGDYVASAYGGRNSRCAKYFVEEKNITFTECEERLLNGQKLQGFLSAKEVYRLLELKGATKQFPFFSTLYLITIQKIKPERILDVKGEHIGPHFQQEIKQ